ncbi:hypothetical protein AADZ90_017300 [Aestuariibius sp. 2305UL40-4]|uniref:hypothetical protein n=1 Tax=Aestuariibius violaceus TaxID=3234132 RepID=UPI00345E9A89
MATTALDRYQRLESGGLWRPDPDAQRRDVVVTFGEATLVISDKAGRALSHWSLPALRRENPDEVPALYSPGLDGGETLEISDTDMIEAIETVRGVISKSRPRPGRVRLLSAGGIALAIAGLMVLWLPGALREHTLSVVPEVKRVEIGRALAEEIERGAGRPCEDPLGLAALDVFRERMGVEEIRVMSASPRAAVALPGGVVVLDRSVIEDHEDPAVAAGYVIAARQGAPDPLGALLDAAGTRTTFRLLTTGRLPEAAIRRHSERLLAGAQPAVEDGILLAGFDGAGVPSRPYAFAIDVSGETVLPLIEGDPFRGREAPPVLSDSDWVSLQQICRE